MDPVREVSRDTSPTSPARERDRLCRGGCCDGRCSASYPKPGATDTCRCSGTRELSGRLAASVLLSLFDIRPPLLWAGHSSAVCRLTELRFTREDIGFGHHVAFKQLDGERRRTDGAGGIAERGLRPVEAGETPPIELMRHPEEDESRSRRQPTDDFGGEDRSGLLDPLKELHHDGADVFVFHAL